MQRNQHLVKQILRILEGTVNFVKKDLKKKQKLKLTYQMFYQMGVKLVFSFGKENIRGRHC